MIPTFYACGWRYAWARLLATGLVATAVPGTVRAKTQSWFAGSATSISFVIQSHPWPRKTWYRDAIIGKPAPSCGWRSGAKPSFLEFASACKYR